MDALIETLKRGLMNNTEAHVLIAAAQQLLDNNSHSLLPDWLQILAHTNLELVDWNVERFILLQWIQTEEEFQ